MFCVCRRINRGLYYDTEHDSIGVASNRNIPPFILIWCIDLLISRNSYIWTLMLRIILDHISTIFIEAGSLIQTQSLINNMMSLASQLSPGTPCFTFPGWNCLEVSFHTQPPLIVSLEIQSSGLMLTRQILKPQLHLLSPWTAWF